MDKITERLKSKNNIEKILFTIFLIFYVIIGVQVLCNHNLTSPTELIFNTDTIRVMNDISSISGYHARLSVHPLLVILTQPIYFLLNGIIHNKLITIVIMSSIVSALSVTIIFKIFQVFSKSTKLSIVLAACYGIAFTCMIFTANSEVYNYATLFLLLLWYFIIMKVKDGWKKKSDFIILMALGISSLGFTITNYFIFLIACLVLLLSKTVKLKKLLLANIAIILLLVGLSFFQKCIWRNTPLITAFFNRTVKVEQTYTNYNINIQSVKNVIKDDIYNPIVSSDVEVKQNNRGWQQVVFKSMSIENKIIITAFLITILIFTLKNFRKNLAINIGIVLSILFNFVLHLLYGNSECFLYSMHFTYLIFILCGINCLSEEGNKPKKYIATVIGLLLLLEILKNGYIFIKFLRLLHLYLPMRLYAKKCGIILTSIATGVATLFEITLFNIFVYFCKKMSKSEDISDKYKYIIYLFILFTLFESVFICTQTFNV